MNKRVIDEQELIGLLIDSHELMALHNCGVNNWDGYQYALNDKDEKDNLTHWEYADLDSNELLKDYPIASEWIE